MAFSNVLQRRTARFALIAVLFSALSPAMAGLLFADRPDILARMLKLQAPAEVLAGGAICHAPNVTDAVPVQPSAAPAWPDDNGGEHAAHGIYCSFCLAASFAALQPANFGSPLPVKPAAENFTGGRVQPPQGCLHATYHPRDPPLTL